MQKGKLIETYIGEGLIPLRFTYEGRRGDSWIFERKVKQLKQTISIHEYRFAKNMISFELYTNVRGKGQVQAANMEGITWNSDFPGYWYYEDEKSFIKVLLELKEIFVDKGIKVLGKLSIPDEIEATNEMYHKLYFEHEELAKKYQEEHNIQVTGFDEENIERWFAILGERITELKKGTYEEAKEELVEMAAFLGEMLVKYRGGNWHRYTEENFESCSVENIRVIYHTNGINILNIMVGGYDYDDMPWVKNIYKKFLE